MSGPYGNTTPIMPCGPAFSTPLLLSFGGEFGVYRREERMSARRRKSDLLQTPSSSSRHTEMTGESVQLQQELETLKQVHSSIKALNHMTVTLYKACSVQNHCTEQTLEVVVQNSNDLQGLNEGWQIFFGQK